MSTPQIVITVWLSVCAVTAVLWMAAGRGRSERTHALDGEGLRRVRERQRRDAVPTRCPHD